MHPQKINQIKEHLEKQGYICRRNSFPVFLPDENRFSFLDLACFKKDKQIGIEVESKNSQMLRNKKGLEEFKRIFPKSKTCQLFSDDDFSKCHFS